MKHFIQSFYRRFSRSKDISHSEIQDSFVSIQNQRTRQDQFEFIIFLALVITLFFMWFKAPHALGDFDQLKTDVAEQMQLIEMEKKNNDFLQAIDDDALQKNLKKLYVALPNQDEESEAVVSMFESMALKNQLLIESINIRELPISQFYQDELIDIVQPYEYTFSIENPSLNSILSFVHSLRLSLRIMDIMSIDIEQSRSGYKATLSVFVYHLI
ncbi:hypothetical protein IPJ72_01355 [Candidatus Peregrinibacteria bacterium]|nr:MAG: hypothetical protein IPJ72_01355 [Candidatus Peregrinibacteria bacterium]